jgi:hypothetical protein
MLQYMSPLRAASAVPSALRRAISPMPANGTSTWLYVVATCHAVSSPGAVRVKTNATLAFVDEYWQFPSSRVILASPLAFAGRLRAPVISAALITSQGFPIAWLVPALTLDCVAGAAAASVVLPDRAGAARCEQALNVQSAAMPYGIHRVFAFMARILSYRMDNAWVKCSHAVTAPVLTSG